MVLSASRRVPFANLTLSAIASKFDAACLRISKAESVGFAGALPLSATGLLGVGRVCCWWGLGGCCLCAGLCAPLRSGVYSSATELKCAT